MRNSTTGFKIYWAHYPQLPIGMVLDMRAIPLGTLIGVGAGVRYLQDVKHGRRVHGDHVILGNIDTFLKNIEALRLKVTKEASTELQQLADKLRSYAPDARITPEHATELNEAVKSLRKTLSAETAILNAYVLTEKRMDVERLVKAPESFLNQETFNKLPSIAQYDIKQAGKCIAFETPTAAAFHLLRATEGTLRAYYCHFIKRERLPRPMWGDMIVALKARNRKPKPNKTLLDHLNNIRNNFRNPTGHPDMIYGMDEAQDLFGVVVDVLNRMAKELP